MAASLFRNVPFTVVMPFRLGGARVACRFSFRLNEAAASTPRRQRRSPSAASTSPAGSGTPTPSSTAAGTLFFQISSPSSPTRPSQREVALARGWRPSPGRSSFLMKL